MAIGGQQVGANTLLTVVLSDPITAANLQNVVTIGDATNLTGKFGALEFGVEAAVNPITGNLDQARFAAGTTGVHAVSTEGTKAAFSFTLVDFTPAATATDFLTIFGSSTKTGRLHRLVITGTATAAATVDMLLVKRSAADSGGTPASITLVPHDSNNPTATCAVASYSANPTLGTALGTVRAEKLNLGAAGAAGRIEWKFTDANDQAAVVRGTGQGLCLNFNGQAVPSGTSLTIYAEFMEDNS